MALYITSLNSGSNGNCYYVGNGKEAVLVDAGLSCREIERRMKQLNLSMQLVKAVFISHEHTDHIKGLSTLVDKYSLPLYCTKPTAKYFSIRTKQFIKNFTADEPVQIGELMVTAFTKHHDAIDPHSFIISYNRITVGVFTDIGAACNNVHTYFSKCHACFLEANYDVDMLENGSYPQYLKNRIRSGKGHLSNHQALEIFTKHKPDFMTHLFLSHLSKDNNNPQLAKQLFTQHAGDIEIVVASRYEATPVYTIMGSNLPLEVKRRLAKPTQMTLFEAM